LEQELLKQPSAEAHSSWGVSELHAADDKASANNPHCTSGHRTD
jgi:hypothetical protein